jgi:hypothetical protein
MKSQATDTRVRLAPDGFYPQTFHWQGCTLRVLYIEGFRTAGMQRRFRVRTLVGSFELGLDLSTGIWRILRRPGWLARARAHLAAQPRYPLPAGRRRAHLPLAVRPPLAATASEGGERASRLALVRQ